MAILHTVNKTGQPFTLCLRTVNEGDTILFFEEGVYVLFEESNILIELIKNIAIFVLEADIRARAINMNDHQNISVIDYPGFVSLTESHDKVLSWF